MYTQSGYNDDICERFRQSSLVGQKRKPVQIPRCHGVAAHTVVLPAKHKNHIGNALLIVGNHFSDTNRESLVDIVRGRAIESE